MKSLWMRTVVLVLVLMFVFFVGWAFMYPFPDQRNIKYVFWKAGLYRLNLAQAEGEMISDPHRDNIVIGKTKAQLERRFGRLIPLADATEYAKFCCQHGSECKNATFVDDGPALWMIVFRGDKATALFLMKGC